MPDVEQIMVAEGDDLSPGTEDVKLEDVEQDGSGGFDPSSLSVSTNTPADADEIVTGESGTWFRKAFSKIWDYIKTKLGISSQGSTGKYLNEQGNFTTPPDTTYNVVSTTENGLAPMVTDVDGYLKGDGTWSIPSGSNYSYMTSTEIANGTDTTDKVMRAAETNSGIKKVMLECCYPVGSIYVSTVNTSPATFLGGQWLALTGNYMLRCASSGVYRNDDSSDGGADSVTISSVASHNHTQNSHDHSLRQRLINGGSETGSMYGMPPRTWITGTPGSQQFTISGDISSLAGSQGASVQSTTATNQSKGSSFSINTLPKYKNVYMWERIS